jgi:hypothetical protein
MCGCAACKLTWEEIVALYRLTLDQPPVNTRGRYHVCPSPNTGHEGELSACSFDVSGRFRKSSNFVQFVHADSCTLATCHKPSAI